jgi:tryptophan synthase alpha chain
MTYYNIVYNYNCETFIKNAKNIGVFWLIIPDIVFDETEWQELIKLCKKYDINLIQVVSPDCKQDRLENILLNSTWLVYAVSQNMTTWNKINLWENFEKYIKNIRKYSKLEIWVWFWIRTKDDVKKVLEVADISIIWSEILIIYDKDWIYWVEKYLKNLSS